MNNRNVIQADKQDLFSLISRYRRQIQGAAALCILFFHVWNVIFTGVPGLEKAEAFIKRITFFGVDIFLFLSGMGLVFSREKSSLGGFYLKRIARLLPPFLLTAVLKVIFDDWSLKRFAYAVTGYGFYRKSIYYFLWFIPAIATLYLLFPLYYRFFSKAKSQFFFTLTGIEIWLILSIFLFDIQRKDLFGFTNRIPIFLLGILLGAFGSDKRKIPVSVPACITSFVLGLYLAFQTNYRDMFVLVRSSNCCVPNILITVGLCPLLGILFSFLKDRSLILKILAFLGGISLELYCIQEWIAEELNEILLERFSPLIVNLILLAIILPATLGIAKINRLIQLGIAHFIPSIRNSHDPSSAER